MTVVAIHQPEYFPWLGYLDKVRRADVFVLLDNVQFDRSSLQQRARVVGPGGPAWMTIPFVHRFPQRIEEVALADKTWPIKHRKTLQACYGRSPGYQPANHLLETFFAADRDRLVDATVASLEVLLSAFDLAGRTKLVRASQLPVTGTKGELVLSLCKHFGASRYLSGRSGAAYLDHDLFRREGIEIEVQSFTLPSYPRPRPLAPEEDKGLSALDAWMHLGEKARDLLDGSAS